MQILELRVIVAHRVGSLTMVACHVRHTNRAEFSSKGDSFETCESIFPRSSGGRGKARRSTCHKHCQSHRPSGRILIAYPFHLPLRSASVELLSPFVFFFEAF